MLRVVENLQNKMDERLKELNDAVQKLVFAVDEVVANVTDEIFDKAPLLIHQRFCSELVKVMQKEENSGKVPLDTPEAVKIMNAIDVLEELYPRLKTTETETETKPCHHIKQRYDPSPNHNKCVDCGELVETDTPISENVI